MEGIIYIYFENDSNIEYVFPNVTYGKKHLGFCDYSFDLFLSNEEQFDSLKTEEKIKRIIDKKIIDLDNSLDKQNIEKLKTKNIIKDVDYIMINGISNEEILEYIKKNPILKTKKIIIPDVISLGDNIDELLKTYQGMDNIYVRVEGNIAPITFNSFISLESKIDNIVNKVKEKNFSTLESLIYIYDIVRSRKYKQGSKDDKFNVSRDLNNILNEEEIVCAGYINLFMAICSKLDIKCVDYRLTGKHDYDNHVRCAVDIKDDKYGVDGIFFFDPTYDSKEDNNDYLSSYMFFGKNLQFFNVMDRKEGLDGKICINDLANRFDTVINNPVEAITDAKLIRTVLFFSKFDPEIELKIEKIIQKKYDTKKLEVIKDKVLKLQKRFVRKIYNHIFISALYNVRKIQHYENPELFILNKEELLNIMDNSLFCLAVSDEEMLLSKIFGEEITIASILKREKESIKKNEKIDKEINGIKLTRTLRLILEEKNKN